MRRGFLLENGRTYTGRYRVGIIEESRVVRCKESKEAGGVNGPSKRDRE